MLPGDIEVGTSGWRFRDWAGTFYPFRVPQSQWLEYYAARFNIGEINSTYYRIGRSEAYKTIARRTPEHFRVFAKVHGDVTHARKNPQESLGYLLSALKPIEDVNKLQGLLAQFPESFKYSADNLDYVLQICEAIDTIRLCVEFRHRSWLNESVLTSFRNHRVVWVTPDEPSFENLLPFEPQLTGDFFYIRMHGRNSAAWYDRKVGDRYDYDYSEEQLTSLGKQLLQIGKSGTKGFIMFNNCHLGQAPGNAWWLKMWLDGMKDTGKHQFVSNGLDFSTD